jgi:hypothetical protein
MAGVQLTNKYVMLRQAVFLTNMRVVDLKLR